MHIYYIHQYFLPAYPSADGGVPAVGNRPYEFATRWVRKGHQVTLFVIDKKDIEQHYKPVRKGWFSNRYQFDGLDVVAYKIAYDQKMNGIQKTISFIQFLVYVTFGILIRKRPDVIYASSTPLTVGVAALIAKWLRGIPFVFEIRDQWPEIPIAMGFIKNKYLASFLLWLEKTIYRNAVGVVALSPGMAKGVHSIVPDKPVLIAPNCADTQVFRPDSDGAAIRQRYGWEGKFLLLHAGTMGRANRTEFVLDAAEKLRDHSDIHFVLIGRGNERPMLQKRIEQDGLTNVTLLNPVPRAQVAQFYGAADAGMVIVAPYPILQDNSANKFFDCLSAGVPVLLNYSGWQGEILELHHAGFGCEQGDVDAFCRHIVYLKTHPQEAKKMGQNARKLAETQFSRDKIASMILETINEFMKK